MGISELQQLAIQMGLPEYRHSSSQTMLVRAIQMGRGESPCFSTDHRYTCTAPCEWRSECIKLRAVWLR